MKHCKKSMTALILVVILLISMLQTGLALTATEQADALKAAGLFLGTGTDYNLTGLVSRDQGITLALRAQGMEPAALAQTPDQIAAALANVADIAEIADWARPYVAYALKQEPAITRGVSVRADGKTVFAPAQRMSGDQLLTFLARAMGYEASPETIPDVAVEAKMLTATQVVRYVQMQAFTREHAVAILHSVVSNGVVAKTGEKLIDKLVNNNIVQELEAIGLGFTKPTPTPTPTPTATPVPERLSVLDVQAQNTKQLLVRFTQEVLLDTVVKANFVVKENGAIIKQVVPTLQTDRRSVLLTLAGTTVITNGASVDVTVRKAVKGVDGTALAEDFKKEALYIQDTILPRMVGAEVIGKQQVKIQFSKPVWDGSDNQVDATNFTIRNGGNTLYVSSATANFTDSTVLVNLGMELVPGNVEIMVNATAIYGDYLRDFNNWRLQADTLTITYTKQTTEPTVQVEAVNKYSRVVTVRFDRPVYGTQVRLYMMVKNVDFYGSVPVSKYELNASDVWEFTMPGPIPTGNVSFFLTNSETVGYEMKDLFGIKVSDKSMTYNNVADTTPPVVASVESTGNTGFDLRFSEALDAVSAQTKLNYEVRNASGSVLAISSVTLLPDLQSVRIAVGTTDQQTYSLRVGGVKDLDGNVMVLWTTTKTVEDSSNPKVTTAYAITSQRRIFITFSEPMNMTDISTKSNYLVDRDGGTDRFIALDSQDNLMVIDSRNIVIEMREEINRPSVKMAAMRDQSGKKLGSDNLFEYSGEAGNLTNIGMAYVSLIKAEAVDNNQVVLTFNTRINNLNLTDIHLRRAANGDALTPPVKLQSIRSIDVNQDGQSVYTVFLDRTINSDATWSGGGTRERIEVQTTAGGTTGTSGTQLTTISHAEALPLLDGFGGGIARDSFNTDKISWLDFDNNSKLDTVVVEYDEAIDPNSMSTVTYVVQGYNITGVSTDADGIVTAGSQGDRIAGARFVILNITQANQGLDAGTRPSVTQLYPIQDTVGNIIE